MRKTLSFLLIFVAALAAIYFAGPSASRDMAYDLDHTAIGADPARWINMREAVFSDIHPGQEKEIIWADPAHKTKTEFAIIYVHGFSASKAEIRPVPDLVAEAKGANLYFMRLAGHGRPGAAMAEASTADWAYDMAEALTIAKSIGDKTIVIATSTGGSLATWAAGQPELAAMMDALVLVSPNFGVKAAGSSLLKGPWAVQLAELIVGEEYSFKPRNERHGQNWTTRYPARALPTMAAIAQLALESETANSALPALFIYSPEDTVVDAALTKTVAERWGANQTTLIIEGADDPNDHVIAGDIVSPNKTEEIAQGIIEWLGALDAE